jgi:hypothetical protein
MLSFIRKTKITIFITLEERKELIPDNLSLNLKKLLI